MDVEVEVEVEDEVGADVGGRGRTKEGAVVDGS